METGESPYIAKESSANEQTAPADPATDKKVEGSTKRRRDAGTGKDSQKKIETCPNFRVDGIGQK